jgi:dihydrofolate synthase/folylpolyglutamate synthase
VVEVGLGGAQDSTNVLQAATCVLTPIGLDHTQWLGETLGEIAAAKAGIVHEAATLVCATQPEAALPAIERRCAEMAATLLMQGLRFGVVRRSLAFGGQLLTLHGLGGEYDDVFLPLHGAHQAQNAAVALAAAECFLGAATPGRRLEPTVVREGFAAATSPGRLEPVRSSPTVLVDAAHNPHGMAATVAALADEFGFTHLVVVLAVLADKDAAGMLALLAPVADELICTQNSSPRAMPAGELAALAGAALPPERIKVCADLAVAVERALQLVAHPAKQRSGVGVLVTGSVVTAGEARTLLAS